MRWALERGQVRGTGFQKVQNDIAVGERGGYLGAVSVDGGGRGPRGGRVEAGVGANFFLVGGMMGYWVKGGAREERLREEVGDGTGTDEVGAELIDW